MAVVGASIAHMNPTTDFAVGNEDLSSAGVGRIDWDALNAQLSGEWGQLTGVYLPVDQSGPMSMAGGRAVVRRVNRMLSMMHNMQFRMLKADGVSAQRQNGVAFVSARVEEAFKKVEKSIADYEGQNQAIMKKTQTITEAKFNEFAW